MTRRRVGCVIATLSLVAASCGGSDDTAGDATVAPSTATSTTAAATSAPTTGVPSTTVVVTTAATTSPTTTTTTTTAAATTALPTTPAPPTTAAALDLRATIERDVNLGEVALLTIGADPAAPEAQTIAAQYFTGRTLENLLAAIDSLVADNLVTQPSPDVANVIVLTSEPVIDPTGTRATAETCRIDATWVLALDDTGRIRVPVNTTVTKTVSATRFTFADGIWKLDGGDVISTDQGAVTCP